LESNFLEGSENTGATFLAFVNFMANYYDPSVWALKMSAFP
jgi:hypothetical protein